jgi:DNA (cytosine-5)-methyltransferase 1
MSKSTVRTAKAEANATQKQQRHRVLDLFSGIGGFSVALRSVADTVGYCEMDPHCLAVLNSRMADGRIDTAPVFNDVRALSAGTVSRLRPDMVVGGFPCQDISSSGQRAGLDGSKSSLFFEIVRLLRSVRSVQHVLLENSPFIRTMGLPRVRAALKEAGFAHVAYGYFTAVFKTSMGHLPILL